MELDTARKRGWKAQLATLLVIGGVAVVVWLLWPAPRLKGETTHDFGLVRFHRAPHYVWHDFELENTSDQPVQIKKYSSSCGCTKAKGGQLVVNPGEVLTVPVSLRLTRSGDKDGTVTLSFRDGGSVDLHVRARGMPATTFRTTPQRVRLRPRVGRGDLKLVMESEMKPGDVEATGPPEVVISVGPWTQLDVGDPDAGKVSGWVADVRLQASEEWPQPGADLTFTLPDGQEAIAVLNPPVILDRPESSPVEQEATVSPVLPD